MGRFSNLKAKGTCAGCGETAMAIVLIGDRCPNCRRTALAAEYAVRRPTCSGCGGPVTDFDIECGLGCELDQRPQCQACVVGALI